MRIDLLDMGTTKYGDCVLIRHAERSILVDGGHLGDSLRIRTQLGKLFGHTRPFNIDLLVVTHCHSDHIGCLPDLVARNDLIVRTALLADEKFGWGRTADGASPTDALDLSPGQRALIAALQEEDHTDLPQDELEEFLLEDVTLEDRYLDMIENLETQGARVIRYGRSPTSRIRSLEAEFADFGLKVLGPTQDHLLICAEAISQGVDALAASVTQLDVAADAEMGSLARAYRSLARRAIDDVEGLADQPSVGPAKNNQSIVLKVAADGWSALLTGDMQFAMPQVRNLTNPIAALRRAVVKAGPYDFIKLAHHASFNAVNDAVLDEWADTKLVAHSGGSRDAHHPEESVLQLLKARRNRLKFARTDRNGLITVTKNGDVKMQASKGRLNDFTPNRPQDEPEPAAPSAEITQPASSSTSTVTATVTETIGQPSGAATGEVVEVVTRIPRRATRVTVTIQVDPSEPAASQTSASGDIAHQPATHTPGLTGLPDLPDLRLAGGRPLPKLLFVTCRPRLEDNIGRSEAARVFDALRSAPSARLVDLPASVKTAEEAAQLVRPALAAETPAGVVVLGGYDVVPAHRLDVLDGPLRRRLEEAGIDGEDADDFFVWSDELYADHDGDLIPELPVSRIPDGRRWEVVFSALSAPKFTVGTRFGVRNSNRPFAKLVFPQLPGQGDLEVSEVCTPETVSPGVACGAVYYMLHGSARDATRFWGETHDGGAFEAVAIENVPDRAAGTVVFTGCCWGALVMSPPAARARPETPLRTRGPEASMAIAYLRAGALAFIGCTGSHYSPNRAPYNYFGRPMHDAFWSALVAGKPPAEALFAAKTEFARRMPHGQTEPFSQAVEVKILRQYTCLGLGW